MYCPHLLCTFFSCLPVLSSRHRCLLPSLLRVSVPSLQSASKQASKQARGIPAATSTQHTQHTPGTKYSGKRDLTPRSVCFPVRLSLYPPASSHTYPEQKTSKHPSIVFLLLLSLRRDLLPSFPCFPTPFNPVLGFGGSSCTHPLPACPYCIVPSASPVPPARLI